MKNLTLSELLALTGDFACQHPHGGWQVFYGTKADRRFWDLADAKVVASLSGPSLHIVENEQAAAVFLTSY